VRWLVFLLKYQKVKDYFVCEFTLRFHVLVNVVFNEVELVIVVVGRIIFLNWYCWNAKLKRRAYLQMMTLQKYQSTPLPLGKYNLKILQHHLTLIKMTIIVLMQHNIKVCLNTSSISLYLLVCFNKLFYIAVFVIFYFFGEWFFLALIHIQHLLQSSFNHLQHLLI